ncbi:MAG: NAD-dependent epimerase/dehydratase family protein [Chlamydiota bacterium]
MKLLVMGAGYVGMALLEYLKHEEHEIYVTTKDAGKVDLLKPYAKEVILLESLDDVDVLIDACDGMIILIAPKNKESYEDTYLSMAKKVSSRLKGREKPFYLLYTSSTSVYEGIDNKLAMEDLILEPKSENAKILLETEKLLLSSTTACVLRLGGIFGPNREISKRALHLVGKKMPGSGDEPTNHIHLDDIVKAIAFCLKHRLTGIYNLVNNDHPTRKELYPNCLWDLSLPHIKKDYEVSNRKILDAGFTLSQSLKSALHTNHLK